MENMFNSEDYIKTLGDELVNDFIKAGKSTHPCSVGSGREKALMNKLKSILPHGIGVGSGFVFDSYGNTSAQCDLIIYEEEYALKFIINDDESYAYYNCENVIAVGEIKSDATIASIEDSFNKLKKIKELKRFNPNPNDNTFRNYLSNLSIVGVESQKFDPENKLRDQIFTFLISKSIKTPLESIASKANEIFKEKHKYFNLILPIEGKPITYLNLEDRNIIDGALGSDFMAELNDDCGFNFFITRLMYHILNGRSVCLKPERYIQTKTSFNINRTVAI